MRVTHCPTKTTRLSVTANKASGSTYSVIASGTSYTKSGDDGHLDRDADSFNDREEIQIYLNGIKQIKAVDAVWATENTFVLNQEVDNGDEIEILS